MSSLNGRLISGFYVGGKESDMFAAAMSNVRVINGGDRVTND